MNVKLSLEIKAKKAIIKSICLLLEKNPTKNVIKILDLSKSLSKNSTTKEIISIIENSYKTQRNFKEFIDNSLESIDKNILKNFIYNISNTHYDSYNNDGFIPFSLLINPTSRCNLNCISPSCTKNKFNNYLTFNDIEKTILEAKELGINCILLFGGEPFYVDFMYKIYEKYNDMIFISFTNGTLIDEFVSQKILNLGNLFPIIALDGFEEYTDCKCGKGSYDKIIRGMNLLKSKSIPFAINCTTTSKNLNEITSDKFIDMSISNGSLFTIYSSLFNCHYDLADMINDDECKKLAQRIEIIRSSKPYFVMDLFNDSKYLEAFCKHSTSLKNTEIFNYRELLFKDISKYNINKMTIKEMIKLN